MFAISFIGYLVIKLLPENIRENANKFLAPVIGLAVFIVILGIFGRLIEFKYFVLTLPAIIVATIEYLIWKKKFKYFFKSGW